MTDSVALPGNPTCERAGGSITRAAVYTELESLLPVVRKQFRPMFSYRWGLEGNITHTLTATAEFTGRSTEDTAAALERCVTNLAIAAHNLELPVIRQMLGPDRTLWPKHAYEQAERWSNLVSRAAEARLFLA